MRGSRRGVVAAIAWLALGLCACAPARVDDAPVGPGQDAAPLLDYLDTAVGTERFRGAVEVRRGEQVLLRRGFGFADPAGGVPNGPNTRFRIASVTRQFTALAVLVLQEQGKLGLANNVCSYLPDCPPQWAPVTIEQLLTHTSGLHDYTDGVGQLSSAGRRPTPDELIGLFAARPLDFPPGTGFAYSDSGYVVLGKLIERVSGQGYGDFLREQVLDPLGMSDTGYRPGSTGTEYAVGHEDWDTPAAVLDDSAIYAAGGMYSTVTDLGRWQRFLLTDDPPVVRADTLAELLRPRVVVSPGTWYGYGIEVRGASTSAIDVFGQSGAVPGFSSHLEARPATGVTITVLANISLDGEGFGRDLAGLVPNPR